MTSAPILPPLTAEQVAAPGRSAGRIGMLVVKAVITFVLLGFLVSKLDLNALGGKLQAATLGPLTFALAIIIAEIPIAAVRWMALAKRAGADMPYGLALKLTLAGLFFGQVLPASIGGDVVRGWFGTRNGLAWKPVVSSLVIDRIIALLAAVILIAGALPWLSSQSGSMMLSAQLSIAVVLVLLSGLFVDYLPLPTALRRHTRVETILGLIAQARNTLTSSAGLIAIGLSLAIHGMTIVAVVAIAESLGLDLPLSASALVVPVALVAAAIPISVNGWGVREGVMVAGFALFGLAQPDAFLISVLLGVSVVISALPGCVAWLLLR